MRFADVLAGRIGRVHLRDQVADTPVPFGEGEAPFEELLNLLTDCGYDGPLGVELKDVDWDQPVPAAIFRAPIRRSLSLRSRLRIPCGLRTAAKAPVGVGQTHPSYEIEAALARLS